MQAISKGNNHGRRAMTVLGLALLALVASGRLVAQSPSDANQAGFELSDDWVLEVDGVGDSGAKIYSSSQSRAILVMRSDGGAPVLIWPRSRVVETLNLMGVANRGEGFVEILKNPVLATHGPFEVVGTTVVLRIDGSELHLKPKPALVGLYDAAGMLDNSKVYARRADAYQPVAETLAKLKSVPGNVRVRVFFGSWCPACSQMVPRILNVAGNLNETNLNFEFYGLPKGFQGEPEATRYNISSVPTGVVFVDEKEVGRLAGNDWRSPESALWKLLGS